MSPKGRGKKKSTPAPAPCPTPNLSPKLMRRFYEPLVLQYVLGPARGSHIQCDEPLGSLDESELGECRLRRSFVDSLAYMCDFEKGGATVTAIALETRPAGVVFWVAANETVKKKVVQSLEEILADLAGLDGVQVADDEFTVRVESTFRRAVELGMSRVKSYWNIMQKPLERCLKILKSGQSTSKDDASGMIAWLSSFKDHKEDMLHLCRFSYDARVSPYMKELSRRSAKAPGVALACMTPESNANAFSELRHFIGRLGSHMRAARTLVAAAVAFPAFFDDFEVKCLPSPKPAKTPPQMNKQATLDKILDRMLPANHKDIPVCRDALQAMDDKFGIHERFVEEYKKPTFLPRVHAELVLLEHFYTNEYDFVDGDRYIGCSKPACYCCYHYICKHPGKFVAPASHNKTYLNWRPPDIIDVDGDGSAVIIQRDIMNEVVSMIRKDLLAQIVSQSGRRRSHPDSTTGITESVVVVGGSYNLRAQ